MKNTTNYSLKKPDLEDYILVSDLNYNMDEIDKLIKSVNDALKILNTDGKNLLELLKKKADLDNGKILVSQLPDLDQYKDVLMYELKGQFPSTGDSKKLYIDKTSNFIYRWNGSQYVEVSKALSIGETTGTAFDGARGKALEDKFKNYYTKAEVDQMIADVKVELETNIIEQILLFS